MNVQNEENKTNIEDDITLIFCIDVSGSMDDVVKVRSEQVLKVLG